MRSPLLLAWKQLTQERLRFVAAVAGVAFASILMLLQLGFRDALFASCVQFHRALRADLVLLSPESSYLVLMKSFPRSRLYNVRGDAQVASVAAAYTGLPEWKNPTTGMPRAIFTIGFDPEDPALDLPGIAENLPRLRLPDRALFDRQARPEFGPVAAELSAGRPVSAEVAGRRIEVVGLFRLGTSFGVDGSLVTSDLNFMRLFPRRSPGAIDLGLVRLTPGADASAVARRLARTLPPDVLVLTRAGYIAREIDYWARSTPVGYVFTLGTIIGFFVGGVIVYQILFTDVSHHLPEYATLKAMIGEGPPVAVPRLDESLQEVLAARLSFAPLGQDRREKLGHPGPGPIAPAMRGKGKVGPQEGDQIQPFLQIRIEHGELRGKASPELFSDQATAGDEDGHRVHRFEQIDLAFLAPAVEVTNGLLDHRLGVGLQTILPQRRPYELELLAHHLGFDVVGDALSEDWNGELIRLACRELVVGRAEERGVGLRAGVDVDPLPRQAKAEDLPEIAPSAGEKRDGPAVELEGVPEPGPTARQHRRKVRQSFPFPGRNRTPPAPPRREESG